MQTALSNQTLSSDPIDVSLLRDIPASKYSIEQPQDFFDLLNATTRFNDGKKKKGEDIPLLTNPNALSPDLRDKVMTDLRQSGLLFLSTGLIPPSMTDSQRAGTLMMQDIHPDDIKKKAELEDFYKRLEAQLRAYAYLWNQTHKNVVEIELAARLALMALGIDITLLRALGAGADLALLAKLENQAAGIKDFLESAVPEFYETLKKVPPAATAALDGINVAIEDAKENFSVLKSASGVVASKAKSIFNHGVRDIGTGAKVAGRGLLYGTLAMFSFGKYIAPYFGQMMSSLGQKISNKLPGGGSRGRPHTPHSP